VITNITNVTAIDGGRTIIFEVTTDAEGANEVVSITLDGEKFATLVQLGPLQVARVSISLAEHSALAYPTKSYNAVVVAERSLTTSDPVDLTLWYKEPRPKGRKQPRPRQGRSVDVNAAEGNI
jgi:hypothetical protein